MHRTGGAIALLLGLVVAGCGGSSVPATTPTAHTPPKLARFLQLPVATPTKCAPGTNGVTSGRRSPWVGHVDVSVFLAADASPSAIRALGTTLRGYDDVTHVYFESRRQALAEFARLYTCSANVRRSAVPPSYRLVLAPVTRPERDGLVSRIRALPGVGTVSCDPSSPCVDVPSESP